LDFPEEKVVKGSDDAKQAESCKLCILRIGVIPEPQRPESTRGSEWADPEADKAQQAEEAAKANEAAWCASRNWVPDANQSG